MCLVIYNKNCHIAEEDIHCYKVLIKNYSNQLITPYVGEVVDITKGQSVDELKDLSEFTSRSYCIDKGAIHSFRQFRFAKELFDKRDNSIIYETIIPAGSKYYASDFEYASQELKYIKEYVFV